jgi:hypothetical protein
MINLVLETIDPSRQVSLISERDRTGSQRIPPLIYKNFYKGYKGKLFGVSISDLAELSGRNVPGWLVKALRIVEKDCSGDEGYQVWQYHSYLFQVWTSQLLNIRSVHALRSELEG